jgi:hypothetical protein
MLHTNVKEYLFVIVMKMLNNYLAFFALNNFLINVLATFILFENYR